ncbi:MAG: CoA transferase [Deltaproteobacteria bacterium]|nr:CoA transferase [Deltaproteobacteria bacterium]
MKRPLEGVRILDLTTFLSGPYAMMIAAYLGAEVVKVERPETGDPVRANPPYFGPRGVVFEREDRRDLSFSMLKRGRGKKSITLNLQTEKGKEICKELVKKVDVVAENFAPGVMDRLGIGYPELRKIKPDIIYCSISGFGQDGPYRSLPAFDPVVQGMSGVMEVTGYPENPPVRMGLAAGDQVAALYAVIGLLAALRYREKTGQGQAVDISMMDSLFSFLFDEALDVYVGRGIPIRTGNRRLRLTPFNSYRAKDGYVVICTASDAHWASLLKAMGREDLIEDPRYKTLDQRMKNADEVDALVEGWTVGKEKKEAVEILRKQGIASGIVATIPEVLADPQLNFRGMIVKLQHPELGKVEGAVGHGIPVRLSESAGNFDRPGPYLGAHNEEIYGGWLGYSKEYLNQLQREGII